MNTKLTSVKILSDLYINFKHICVEENMSLQKLVNRSIFLYVNDKDYKEEINNVDQLALSGSKL